MIFTAAELQAANHLLENSLQRWTTFMSTKDKWMFNFYSDDDLPLSTRWRSLNALGAQLVKKGGMSVQINRSAHEAKLKETDVWGKKDSLDGWLNLVILEENFQQKTLQQLRHSVLEKAIQHIQKHGSLVPKIYGPWKTFLARQEGQKAQISVLTSFNSEC